VDDSAYLTAVINDVRDRYNVDRKRIFVLGHSNGGFMAYRMACDHAALIAGVVSLEGAMYADDSKCDPSEPVSVVEVHGNADTVIRYEGGTNNAANPDAPPYPSAEQTVQSWAAFDHCDPTAVPASPATRQLLVDKPPAMASAFDGCADGTAVELWTQPDGGHVPKLDESFTEQVVDFLLAHPKA
jgi:polyhydroxybutyrate depolymerase